MKLAAAFSILALLLLSGCSGTGTTSGAPTPPMEDGTYIIHLTSANKFSPAAASIPAGSTVKWVVDGGLHDVTEGSSGDAHAWSSKDGGGPEMTSGMSYEHKFDTAGTVHFRCMMHESVGMVGTLTVT
jgi:plastocyanin